MLPFSCVHHRFILSRMFKFSINKFTIHLITATTVFMTTNFRQYQIATSNFVIIVLTICICSIWVCRRWKLTWSTMFYDASQRCFCVQFQARFMNPWDVFTENIQLYAKWYIYIFICIFLVLSIIAIILNIVISLEFSVLIWNFYVRFCENHLFLLTFLCFT